MNKTLNTQILRQKAAELGFIGVGISKAEELTEEARLLEKWLNKNYHGEMQYMENHFDKRIDPRKLVEGAKTVVSLLFNYYNPNTQADKTAPKISMYAYGEDYHEVIKARLKQLVEHLKSEIGDINGRVFVDSAPVMERVWASRSGLGWVGKHTLLINRQNGSYFFIANLISDVEFLEDSPIKDYCGTCDKCVVACPTQAISREAKLLDASRCISYFTIEYKKELPQELKNEFENWVFGCDVCQQVCPWNRFSKPHNEPAFAPKNGLLDWSKSDWYEMTEEVFKTQFIKSAVKRTKYTGLRRNLDFLG